MDIKATLEAHALHFLQGIKAEYRGDQEAGAIIRKYLSEGTITEEEDQVLRTQVLDSLKIVGIGVPFALIPGASIVMPILIKVAARHNIDLIPSTFTDPNKQQQQG